MQKFVPPPTPITVAEDEIVPFLINSGGSWGETEGCGIASGRTSENHQETREETEGI